MGDTRGSARFGGVRDAGAQAGHRAEASRRAAAAGRALVVAAALIALCGARSAHAQQRQLGPGTTPSNIAHCTDAIAARNFPMIFKCGDTMFETPFNAAAGGGGDVGNGERFTRVPRYDLPGYIIQPVLRSGGPNAQSCVECHQGAELGGGGDGPGSAALNNVQDRVGPSGKGAESGFVVRNSPHLFGLGAVQVLAEEMTTELQALRQAAIAQACTSGKIAMAPLTVKGVSFGMLRITPSGGNQCMTQAQVDTSQVQGVDPDLVVRSFGIEGAFAGLRSFVLSAFQSEIGMEPVEFAGMDKDNDRDGVSNEILVDDATAMTVYLAAQPRPVSELELDRLRQVLQSTPQGKALADKLPLPELSAADRQQIARGEATFKEIGCAACHVPAFALKQKRFAEPSPLASFRQASDRSISGIDLIANRVDPAKPLGFDLSADQPDNRLMVNGRTIKLGSFETNAQGQVIVRLFSDMKRHAMGWEDAEGVDRMSESNTVIPRSVYFTAPLWGISSTAPYLHDGSATTLEEAVVAGHGGEADASRTAFKALPQSRQADLIRFMRNLKLFFPKPDENNSSS